MSHRSHADHRAVENMYAVTNADGSHGLVVMLERRYDVSSGAASIVAGHARDMAHVLATAFKFDVPDLLAQDNAIKQLPFWRAEAAEQGRMSPPAG